MKAKDFRPLTRLAGILTLTQLCAAPAMAQSSIIRSDLQSDRVEVDGPLWQPESLFDLLTDPNRLGGFDDLVPYVLASPNQEDAGSCLYMATTGIAEWWLARLNPTMSRTPDGPLDLSERFLMNVAGIDENETKLDDWRTDSIYLFNNLGNHSVRNTKYRYTKGWYKTPAGGGDLIPAEPKEPGAEYGTSYNWISELDKAKGSSVTLPKFKRDVLFADPAHNQWNIGVAPDGIVDRVKQALTEKKAPVLVIYNHNTYWHAVYVVGFNDETDNNRCAYTENFRKRISDRIAELEKAANEAKDEAERKSYLEKAQRAREAREKTETAYSKGGGCKSGKGVFYIRDSIYEDPAGPMYDYDLFNKGEEAPYTKKIVTKEYEWLSYFANHIVVISPE
jgi:hypothetical protein